MAAAIMVTLDGREVAVPAGTTVRAALELHPGPETGDPPLGAVVNNRIEGLYRPLRSAGARVRTVGLASKEGVNLFRRTVTLILAEAVARRWPRARLEVGQALASGYFYRVQGLPGPVDAGWLDGVETEMRAIVAADLPLKPGLVAAEEAEQLFLDRGYPEKALLVRHRQRSEVPMIRVGSFADMLYGPVVDRTGLCGRFRLLLREPGFVLCFPNRRGRLPESLPYQPKLFEAHREAREWAAMAGVWSVSQLNQACIDGSISDTIKVCEGLQEKKIATLADQICAARGRVRMVLVAGPSSSGKTTFTKRLSIQLRVNGIRPVALSMDDWYVDRAATPRNRDGSYDFENIEALDLPLLDRQVGQLLEGEPVDAPIFDFTTGERRRDRTRPMRLAADQMLVVEGIHGLNPRLLPSVDRGRAFRVYVSALAPLAIDGHNRIFTSDTRLLRRIVRDRLFRNYQAAETIRQWPHVRAGEETWIYPYQEQADALFNTALAYESSVLKPYLARFLMEVAPDDPAYVEAYRLFHFLNLFIPVFPHEVPPTSLLREFIGGSAFQYA